jgi:uncharacterized protein (TIGR03382 family)
VSNAGPSDARDATATVTLPANAQLVSASGASCSGTTTLSCDLGPVAAGAMKSASLVLLFSDTTPGQITAVSAPGGSVPDTDTSSANDTAALSTAPILASNASVSGAASVDGTNAAVTLDVHNDGPSKVTATVTVTIPPGVSVTGAVVNGGSCAIMTASVVCTVDQLGGGQTAAIALTANAPADGTYTVTAAVSAPGDVNPSDNTFAVDFTVAGTGSGMSAGGGDGTTTDPGALRLSGVKTQGGFYRCSASGGGAELFTALALLVLLRLRRRRR